MGDFIGFACGGGICGYEYRGDDMWRRVNVDKKRFRFMGFADVWPLAFAALIVLFVMDYPGISTSENLKLVLRSGLVALGVIHGILILKGFRSRVFSDVFILLALLAVAFMT